MKTKFFYSLILLVGFAFAGSSFSNVYGQTDKKTEMKEKKVLYACPMHPEVKSDKHGKCSKCGMALVEKKEVKKDAVKKDKTTKEKEMPMK